MNNTNKIIPNNKKSHEKLYCLFQIIAYTLDIELSHICQLYNDLLIHDINSGTMFDGANSIESFNKINGLLRPKVNKLFTAMSDDKYIYYHYNIIYYYTI